MKEYGGYIELDTYRLPMLHDSAIALNCGRNCLAYLIEAREIKNLMLPYFMCDSVFEICKKYDIKMSFYNVDEKFKLKDIVLDNDTWLYVMNYYGQLSREYLSELKYKYDRVIVDNAWAYFDEPITGIDTLYTCRKFFGVADGAFLYTDAVSNQVYPQDESFERMHFLMGRFERSASEFYNEYAENNKMFANEPVKQMSKLTINLLHGIDYDFVKQRRSENFRLYNKELNGLNQLSLREVEGAFAYPLLIENGATIRKALQKKKIYIPTLWPNVLDETPESSMEYRFANDLLALPCDQRYNSENIFIIIGEVRKCLEN